VSLLANGSAARALRAPQRAPSRTELTRFRCSRVTLHKHNPHTKNHCVTSCQSEENTHVSLPPPVHGTTGTWHYGKSQKSQRFEKYQSSQISCSAQEWHMGPPFQTAEVSRMVPGQHRGSKLHLPTTASFLNKLAYISWFCGLHSPQG